MNSVQTLEQVGGNTLSPVLATPKRKHKPLCVISDIDGTLADVAHRSHFMDKPKDWIAFYGAMNRDRVHSDVAITYDALTSIDGRHFPGILCTGRPESYRKITDDWLCISNIRYELLLMRKDRDYRPDHVVKREMLGRIREDYEPFLVFDNRSSVVKMWREEGLTCLQVAEGDF